MRLPLLTGLTLMSLLISVQSAEVRRYTILVDNGVKAGEQIVEVNEQGETKVRFIYKDNGRGPELNETIKLNPDGTIASYQGQGKSTFIKAIVNEFEYQGNIKFRRYCKRL